MAYTNRPGALESDRAGENVLAGTLPHTIRKTPDQHRESADDYHRVVAILNDRWRVIECRDGIQWILQRRNRAETVSSGDWRGRRYHRDRHALIISTGALCGDMSAAAVMVLAALPPTFEPDGHEVRWITRHCRVSTAAARTIAEHAGIGGRCG